MSRRMLVATFEREEDILAVTRAVRRQNLRIVDVYAPYAVHGLDKALGLPPSRLPRVCFVLGLVGAAAKVGFEYWASWINWPVNVGGKPWDSLPAFVPLTFEIMVLFAGASTVLAFFWVSRMFPGKKVNPQPSRATNDQFALVLEQTGGNFNIPEVRKMLMGFRASGVEERVQ